MLTKEEATQIAMAWLHRLDNAEECFVLLVEQTEAYPYGWVFFYQSAAYLRTQDIAYALAGNAPIVVDHTGQVQVTGTAHPLAYYLQELARKLA